ncbi:hypothetical protein GCM10010178_41770 [Lentzea flava]|uniref:Uncharacterized protein n=1 Tax=Lentzea flava TaxID=103732 RepID=A0ABQ2UMF5_9PSEU|nr:hypothetical protein GCM10010178_41770 [Lentzea flava]
MWSSVALYSSTGMLTSPKLIDPLQIARAMRAEYPLPATSNHALTVDRVQPPLRAACFQLVIDNPEGGRE